MSAYAPASQAPLVPGVVDGHIDEALELVIAREAALAGARLSLRELLGFDNRLAAHLEGLSTAAAQGHPGLAGELGETAAGVFIRSLLLVETAQPVAAWPQAWWSRADARRAILAALSWIDPRLLHASLADLSRSPDPRLRAAALGAHAAHQIDPGAALAAGMRDGDAVLRAASLRAAGELGRTDVLDACAAAIQDTDPDCAAWAASSAVVLGDRARAVDALATAAVIDGAHRTRAFHLALQAMTPADGHAFLQRLARDAAQLRLVIQGSGIVGDPAYVPWLIGHLRKPETARLAGEAFTAITGADLEALGLETTRPEGFESGPTDDPADPNVDMDPDEGLPWPDAEKVEAWWAANAGRFPKGERLFMGAPVTPARCLDVLGNGFQRQRVLAAHYLCLLDPGTPLFNTCAPAWRQQRLLARQPAALA